MESIATLYQFKRYLGVTGVTEDDRLRLALEAATAKLEAETQRTFCPYVADIAHNVNPMFPQELILHDDLLTLHSITDAGGAVDLTTITQSPAGNVISLLHRTSGEFLWVGSPAQAVTVSGVWGYHDAPVSMWQPTGDSVQDASLSADAATITVTDVDASYADGLTPRFSAGALLNINGEFVRVLDVDTDANTITVKRGVRGTTAAAHPQGTPISVYRPPYAVLMAALWTARWMLREPDVQPGQPLPPDVYRAASRLRRLVVAS